MLQKIIFEENKEYRAVREKLLFQFLRKFYSDNNFVKYFSIVFFLRLYFIESWNFSRRKYLSQQNFKFFNFSLHESIKCQIIAV